MRHPTLVVALLATASSSIVPAQQARYRDPVFATVDVLADLQYGTAISPKTNQRETLRLDRYQPAGDTAALRPALVLIHGGSFIFGDKGDHYIARLARFAAQRGFVVVSVNYRLLTSPPRIRQQVLVSVEDSKAAVRYVRRHARAWRVDPDRIACLGNSAGATICMEIAYGGSGPGQSGNPGYRDDVQAVVELWGALSNPAWIEAHEAPLMIVHGTADQVVSFQWSIRLWQRALQVGLPHDYQALVGKGHDPLVTLETDHIDELFAFLFAQLRLDEWAGLQVRPGQASPGTIQFDSFTVRGEVRALLVSDRRTPLAVPNLGTWWLDPFRSIPAQIGHVGGTEPFPVTTVTLPVPAGLRGRTLHWQEVRVGSNHALRAISNSVSTRF